MPNCNVLRLCNSFCFDFCFDFENFLSDMSPTENEIFKKKYRELKMKFKTVVTNNEFLISELRHHQKKLQILEEDKHFLIERLLKHEKAPESPSESQHNSDLEPDLPSVSVKKSSKIVHPGGISFSSAFSKHKTVRHNRKARKPAKQISEYIDSPTGYSNIDEEDTHNFGLGIYDF